MLHDEGNRRAEDGGGDYYRRELELQIGKERHQTDINPIELKVRGNNVDHPKPDYHARDELGILQKCRQVCTPPVIDRGRFDRSCQIYLRRRHRGIGQPRCQFVADRSFTVAARILMFGSLFDVEGARKSEARA